MWAWCHGAPGIGLARLGLLPLLDDAPLHDELVAALQSTLTHGFGGGHSLCHGDFGNLELFVAAAESLHQPALLEQARQMASALLAAQPQNGWRCGVPGGVETPGLMVGLAGIGYNCCAWRSRRQSPPCSSWRRPVAPLAEYRHISQQITDNAGTRP